jgi:hypothetical protein
MGRQDGMPMALMDLIRSLIPCPCYWIVRKQKEINQNKRGGGGGKDQSGKTKEDCELRAARLHEGL